MLLRRRTTLTLLSALALALPLALAGVVPAAAADDETSAAATHGWGSPSWSEEFEGSSVDTSAWQLYAGPGNAGAGVRDPAQASVSGGVLTIAGTADGTTGGMNDRTPHRYGRWETRMRVPAGDARYHPVLLLWPTDVEWPTGGEIDYAETTTAAPDVSFFLHHGADNQQTYAQTPVDLTRWHDYAVEWTPSAITGYVDGVEVFRDADPSHQPPGQMHSSIQLDWVPSGSSATTPSSIQVDWTRYYKV